jgi:hypothetical protein
MPGGVAALVTALVGGAALFRGRGDGADTPAAASQGTVSGHASAAPSPGPATGEVSADPHPASSSVALQVGEGVDVDTGQAGSNVVGELTWRPNVLFLYGRRNAVVPAAADEAGCVAALERRSDGWLTADRLTGGAVVCLSTDQGAVALARISPPDATDRITVDLTVWPH